MTVHITPRARPTETDSYIGITGLTSDGMWLTLHKQLVLPQAFLTMLPLVQVAEIRLAEDEAELWPSSQV